MRQLNEAGHRCLTGLVELRPVLRPCHLGGEPTPVHQHRLRGALDAERCDQVNPRRPLPGLRFQRHLVRKVEFPTGAGPSVFQTSQVVGQGVVGEREGRQCQLLNDLGVARPALRQPVELPKAESNQHGHPDQHQQRTPPPATAEQLPHHRQPKARPWHRSLEQLPAFCFEHVSGAFARAVAGRPTGSSAGGMSRPASRRPPKSARCRRPEPS